MTPTPPEAIDRTRCPLCGQPNACAAEQRRASGLAQPPCWCTRVTFSHEVLDRVPPAARNQACVCAACATRQE